MQTSEPYASTSSEYPGFSHAAQETWRLLRSRTERLLRDYAPRVHPSYRLGYRLLFGDCHEIPPLEALNEKLRPFGWGTVRVNGYVRPDMYAQLVASRTFPVAVAMREPQHVDHSPVPDLAHDLIGHLPMLVDENHRDYLQRIGEAMARTTLDARDLRLYRARRRAGYLRRLRSSASRIRAADRMIAQAEAQLAHRPSPLTLLSRLYLWTIEFGLLGSVDSWVAYGAGLLSSPIELGRALSGRASILPVSNEVGQLDVLFCDPQPRYFVARDYDQLRRVLDSLVRHVQEPVGQLQSDTRTSPGERC